MIEGYYFITDACLSKAGNISDIENAVEAGVKVVQYRNKEGSTRQRYEEARKAKEICKGKALLIINDDVGIALAVGADGVHLGQDDMPYDAARRLLGENSIIGLTVHNVEEALEAEKKGVDYLGASPIFETSTKKDAGKAVGPQLIKDIKGCCKIPVVAIGGINHENAGQVVDAGADALCAISAVVAKDDVKAEIQKIQGLFE